MSSPVTKQTDSSKSPGSYWRNYKGFVLMSIGMLIIPVMDAVAKVLTQSGYPGLQVAGARFLTQIFFTLIIVFLTAGTTGHLARGLGLVSERPGSVMSKTFTSLFDWFNIVRGWTLGLATVLFFTGLSHMPLPESTAILFLGPILLSIMAVVVLGEKLTWFKVAGLVIGLVCVLAITKPGLGGYGLVSLYPVGAAFLFSVFFMVTRVGANKNDPMIVQFATSLHAFVLLAAILLVIVIASPGNLVLRFPDDAGTLWLFLLLGLISTIAHVAIILAFSMEKASSIAHLSYLEMVSATVLGYFVFEELPDRLSVAASLVIILTGFALAKNIANNR